MVNTDVYAETIGQKLFTGAASHKMISVVRALREVGVNAWLVSLPVLGHVSVVERTRSYVIRHGNVPGLYLNTVSNRYLRKLLALVSFAFFCMMRVRRTDVVILYNHAFEYALGALILWMKCRPAHIDIEDSPRDDVGGFMATLDRVIFWTIMRITREPRMVASYSIANNLGLTDPVVVYGVAEKGTGVDACLQEGKRDAECVRVLFGGTLIKETGLELFCDAVRLLATGVNNELPQVTFVITGVGGEVEVRALSRACVGSRVNIEYFGSVDRLSYQKLLRSCSVGLALKLPESTISTTTFPSKVIEITSQGLLLISTRVSDVPLLFNQTNSILLEHATAEELVKAFLRVLRSPDKIKETATRGQSLSKEKFSSVAVGSMIGNRFGIPTGLLTREGR